ncbi:uncharacterized protein LY89DRAFT_777704 [Mollisia scopiformis]|uniref:Cyclase n=1 Tax=Mollisia scopiformis TaxID=149040 RepID=A0A194XSD5_MOLSC|nr:uncharacterized protein LY89DRAFT_777704 [Mollisia scopiformis]KUJ22642.1 hypothetical protein LY89DRAFT_777704 [Mollisia scopiformis]
MKSSLYTVVSAISLVSAHPHAALNPKVLVSRQFNTQDPYTNWPTYDQLPLDPSYPTKAAWGVWGADDVQGALNHITNATILAARGEIQLGRAINLNMDLNAFTTPINPNRKPLNHLFQPGDGYTDDVVVLNTQVSTQYDGLRHFPYSTDGNTTTYQWYNDLIENFDQVVGPAPTEVLGIQQAAQKGIAGRGVLLDFVGWALTQNMTFDAFTGYGINTSSLDAIAAWQGLPSNWSLPGDMLLIRTGWTKAYLNLTSYNQEILPWDPNLGSVGMNCSDDSLAWLWEKKLALIGADNPAFESLPMDKTIGGVARSLHQVFIGGWGQSIVEFLDLETLAEELHQLGRSTFFLTIQNLNIKSGIASPPNALAIL